MNPELSILIVSYNSRADLARCLPTIYAQNYRSYEIILVDNHGHDGVAEFVTNYYPTIQLISNPANTGYAGGNNLGLRQVKTPWLLLLNPDTELRPGCLAMLMETAHTYPDALITPKLLNPDGLTINTCGNQMHYTGITTCRGLNEPSEAYHGLQSVSLLSGAAFVAPTEALRRLGGFDETYFMYFEDTDLSLRARLLGYSLFCQADAEIVHHYTLNMNAGKFYYLERNRLLTLGKVLSQKTLISLLPALFLTELATWAYALRGWAFLRARWRGYGWLWTHRKPIRQARQTIQATRQLDDRALLRASQTTLPVTQVATGSVGKMVGQISEWLFGVLRPQVLR
jgi:hypothetical protein